VTLWDKSEARVDETNRTIGRKGESIRYDYLIQGDVETPNLPPIAVETGGRSVDYEYVYRENYLGVIPRKLHNIYLLGYTRPVTGGLANVTEIQSLLIHRLLTDDAFRSGVLDRLDEKISDYNRRYHLTESPGPRDHLAYYGFYTSDVARELGIDVRLKSCRSFRDVAKYFCYPNNADKYRQAGRYKIDGCAEFVDRVFTRNKGFKLVWQLAAAYQGYRALAVGVAASLFLHGWIDRYALAAVVVFQLLFGYWVMIPIANSTPFLGVKLLSFVLYIPMLLSPVTALSIFPIDFLATYVLRQLPGARYPFNDLKNKKRYREFFQRYKEVYNRVRRPVESPPAVAGD
jgi:hypothetical protein